MIKHDIDVKKTKERTSATEEDWGMPSPPIVIDKHVWSSVTCHEDDDDDWRRRAGEGELRQKSNNPNLKGGEKCTVLSLQKKLQR